MPRTERTRQEKLLQRLRTHSLLAHGMKSAGFFTPAEESIELSELVARITRAQGGGKTSMEWASDAYAERRIARWISGEVAASRDLDRLLAAWDEGFKGAIWSYQTGPGRSRLFQVLAESLESEAFFIAADTQLEELIDQGRPRRLSERVSDRLRDLRKETDSTPESVMRYLATVTAWFRYALITLHSMSYLAWHVNEVLERLRRVQKIVKVGNTGVIAYPISIDAYCDYLVEMLSGSMRYRHSLYGAALGLGEESWQKASALVAPQAEYIHYPGLTHPRRAGSR
jgi:hypothetical protein